MEKITQTKLEQLLQLHKQWLADNTKGKRLVLSNYDLRGFVIRYTDLQGANLRNADLRGADLQGANLRDACLEGANLRDACLLGANLRGACLEGANLRGACLEGANLRDACLEGVNLRDADLRGACLEGVKGIIYICSPYYYKSFGYYHNGCMRVQLGCYNRTIEEWDADFWNNAEFFPKGSPQGKNRYLIYSLIKTWLVETFKENGDGKCHSLKQVTFPNIQEK